MGGSGLSGDRASRAVQRPLVHTAGNWPVASRGQRLPRPPGPGSLQVARKGQETACVSLVLGRVIPWVPLGHPAGRMGSLGPGSGAALGWAYSSCSGVRMA